MKAVDSQHLYYVVIFNIKTLEEVKQIGPHLFSKAERVETGVLINLGDDYDTVIRPVL